MRRFLLLAVPLACSQSAPAPEAAPAKRDATPAESEAREKPDATPPAATDPAAKVGETTPDPDPSPKSASAWAGRHATVALATTYGCAIGSDAQVYCWGANDSKQLGVEGPETRDAAVPVPGITGAVSIAVTSTRGCALDAAGKVSCWKGSPTKGVPWTDEVPTRQLAFTGGLTCALDSAAKATCMTTKDAAVALEGVVELVAGSTSVCGRDAEGAVRCVDYGGEVKTVSGLVATELALGGWYAGFFARNEAGGLVKFSERDLAPSPVLGVPASARPFMGRKEPPPADTAEYSERRDVACRRDTAGAVSCRGHNGVPGLGRGAAGYAATPVKVEAFGKARDVGLGLDFECWVGPDGEAQCRGDVPNEHPGLLARGATEVEAGHGLACALLANGGVTCTDYEPTPRRIKGISGARRLAVAPYHACALDGGGKVKCWGSNEERQLDADPDAEDEYLEAVTVASGAIDVAAGDASVCWVTRGGKLKCYGGQNEMAQDSLAAVTGLKRLELHEDEAPCVMTKKGVVHCGDYHSWIDESEDWVEYTDEDIGRAKVTLPARVTDLEFSGSFACALTETGGVLCWGENALGQLGRGSTGDDGGPAPVSGLEGVTALAVESDRACAVTRAGVWCWGEGVDGVLKSSEEWGPVQGLP